MPRLSLETLGILILAACGNTTGLGPPSPLDVVAGYSGVPTMDPGQDCLACHSMGARASYRPFTLAGTVFGSPGDLPDAGVSGAQVLVVDGNGKALTLTSNAAGNFYTEEALQFPLQSLEIQKGAARMAMNLSPSLVPPAINSCNLCHNQPPAFAAPGRLFVPGQAQP